MWGEERSGMEKNMYSSIKTVKKEKKTLTRTPELSSSQNGSALAFSVLPALGPMTRSAAGAVLGARKTLQSGATPDIQAEDVLPARLSLSRGLVQPVLLGAEGPCARLLHFSWFSIVSCV